MKTKEQPKVSVIIPNHNHRDLLEPCVESVIALTTYKNYEIIIIENNSTDSDIFEYYDKLSGIKNVRILHYPHKIFNYQKAINYGVEKSDAEFIVQLNNDTILLSPDWLDIMTEMAQQEDIGVVGAKLYYPDMSNPAQPGSIQHAGGYVYLLYDNNLVCEHLFRHLTQEEQKETDDVKIIQEVAWVTGACLMMEKIFYQELGGMDEDFRLAMGDVDLCMKVRQQRRSVVVHPQIEFIHSECSTRGAETTKEEEMERDYFVRKWKKALWLDLGGLSEKAMKMTVAAHGSQPWIIGNLALHFEDMKKQRDNRDEQIAAIYRSNSWKIGRKITRIIRFFLRE